MKTYDDFAKAIAFGNEFLPRVGFYDLAKLIGITESQLMAVIVANKAQFSISPEKTIGLKSVGKIEFPSGTDSFNWFLKNRCGGSSNLLEVVYTQNSITNSVTSPIHWARGDIGFAVKIIMDISQDGAGAKQTVITDLGNEYSSRVECLGRVGGGGSNQDKYLFGIVLKPSEIVERVIGSKKLYYHKWVEEEANSEINATWTWPSDLVLPVHVSAKWERSEVKEETKVEEIKKIRKTKLNETPPPVDVPGQQVLPGADPKPVETAPPASIIKTPAQIVPPAPVTTSETLKQDIRTRAVGDAAAAGTLPPAPPALGGAPPAMGGTPTQPTFAPVQVVSQPAVVAPVQTPVQSVVQTVQPTMQMAPAAASELLDSLLQSAKQK